MHLLDFGLFLSLRPVLLLLAVSATVVLCGKHREKDLQAESCYSSVTGANADDEGGIRQELQHFKVKRTVRAQRQAIKRLQRG